MKFVFVSSQSRAEERSENTGLPVLFVRHNLPPPPSLARFYGKIRCFNYRFDYLQTAEYMERQRKVSKQECLFYLLIELNKKQDQVLSNLKAFFWHFISFSRGCQKPIPRLRRLVLELGSNSYCFIR